MSKEEVDYHEDILDDLAKIPKNIQKRIRIAIETRIIPEPSRFGEPLRMSLAGHRKLRVGDYRVVYQVHEGRIRIWMIDHRKKVYSLMERRNRRGFRKTGKK